MESQSYFSNKPILNELQIVEQLIFETAAPDKIILMASNQKLRCGISSHYLYILITLPTATNESRRCIRDKIEHICLDHGFYVNLLVHTAGQLNNMLLQNSYFFYMVKKIVLCFLTPVSVPFPS